VLLYTAASAIEIACTDAAAQLSGVPVYRFLGGPFQTRIKAYANGWYTGDLEPDDVAERGREVAERGFEALKIDPFGTVDLNCDASTLTRADLILRELRAATGPDVEIMLEGHGRFDVASALRVADRLSVHDLAWFEEPVRAEALEAQAAVAARSPIPVAAGERLYTPDDFRRAVEMGALHIAQPDILHVGGFSGMQDIAAICATAGVLVAPHNSNSPLCTVASLHSGASFPNMRIQETFDAFDDAASDAVTTEAELVDGWYTLGDAAGLGAAVDEEVANRLAPNPGQFNLFAEEWHRRAV
jgi:galactonate dehydratase